MPGAGYHRSTCWNRVSIEGWVSSPALRHQPALQVVRAARLFKSRSPPPFVLEPRETSATGSATWALVETGCRLFFFSPYFKAIDCPISCSAHSEEQTVELQKLCLPIVSLSDVYAVQINGGLNSDTDCHTALSSLSSALQLVMSPPKPLIVVYRFTQSRSIC